MNRGIITTSRCFTRRVAFPFLSSSSMSSLCSDERPSVVAVIGTTGVGKTQLSIQLSQLLPKITSRYKAAEVINSDSIQVYKGLDLITNKATKEERQGVQHHLLGFLDPGKEYDVHQFRKDSIQIVNDLTLKSSLPILVGGTTYYLQHLLFPHHLIDSSPPTITRPDPSSSSTPPTFTHFPSHLQDRIHSLPKPYHDLLLVLRSLPQTSTPTAFPPEFPTHLLPIEFQTPESFSVGLYELYKRLDEEGSQRWHWRDLRKVRRSLEIFLGEGKEWNEIRKGQIKETEAGGRTTYKTLIFWLFAESEVLNERLDKRVDKMIESGLLKEIDEMWSLAHSPTGDCDHRKDETDYSKGVFQAIGYKEFSPFLSSRSSIEGGDPKLFRGGVERMKISTRQYAKKQVKWIKSKLLPAINELKLRDDVTIVLLDTTDLAKWKGNVEEPAETILKAFLADEPIPDPTKLSILAAENLSTSDKAPQFHKKMICSICTIDETRPFLVDEHQWKGHPYTKTHKRRLKELNPKPRVKHYVAQEKEAKD